MLARHYIVGFAIILAVCGMAYSADAQQKDKTPPAKVAAPAATAPPQCQAENTEIQILQSEVNNYRKQVARLAAVVESVRAERDQLKGVKKE